MAGMNDLPQRNDFDVAWCRNQFPALGRCIDGRPVAYFDGPAGSQVPRRVVDAVSDYMLWTNAERGGLGQISRESDAMIEAAHRALADLVGSDQPETIIFGPNMTTLTLGLSRALGRTWGPGDQIVVTRQDHDANVSPWVLAARDAGATVRQVGIRGDDCTLDIDELAELLSPQTRLVAVSGASNAAGTINPAAEIVRLAHGVGALVFVDAVHLAPHGLLDVHAWDCDFLACSAYKFFGPHVGVLWGRRELLEELPAYKLRPAPDDLPGRWMTGTQSHEGIAGTMAAVEYLADLGRHLVPDAASRRAALQAAFTAITAYERRLAGGLLAGLAELPGVKVWGITDPERLDRRAPTVSITHHRLSPRELAAHLAERAIFTRHGNFYALPLTEALGLEPDGLLRIGLLHYNTEEEVQRLLEVLAELE